MGMGGGREEIASTYLVAAVTVGRDVCVQYRHAVEKPRNFRWGLVYEMEINGVSNRQNTSKVKMRNKIKYTNLEVLSPMPHTVMVSFSQRPLDYSPRRFLLGWVSLHEQKKRKQKGFVQNEAIPNLKIDLVTIL